MPRREFLPLVVVVALLAAPDSSAQCSVWNSLWSNLQQPTDSQEHDTANHQTVLSLYGACT